MKALERYVKKSGKADPYGGSKAKGTWKGPKGVKSKSQYAKESGKKVVEDEKDFDESDPGEGVSKKGAYESLRAAKKKKPRAYMDC